MKRRSDGALHVLEFGLAWPPDAYLRVKLADLGRLGIQITVVSYSQFRSPFLLPGLEVIPMPVRGLPAARLGLGVARELILLAARFPRRLSALLSGKERSVLRPPRGGAYSRSLRDRLEWLWLIGRLAPLEPDVVHIEWESVAVKYLPLLDLWRCPMVMTCWGGLDLYAQELRANRWIPGVPDAFARATAVYCVSEAVREEAIRHGLDPSKAHVTLAGVDTERFAPAERFASP